MIRYLKENDIKQLLTMPIALECVEQALKDLALGHAVDIPRARTHIPAGIQPVLQAAAPALGLLGFKYYYTRLGAKRFYVHLIHTGTPTPDAIIDAVDEHGAHRAASGVATRHLANDDAGIVGQDRRRLPGDQPARSGVRGKKIRTAQVYSRNPTSCRPTAAACRRSSASKSFLPTPRRAACAARISSMSSPNRPTLC